MKFRRRLCSPDLSSLKSNNKESDQTLWRRCLEKLGLPKVRLGIRWKLVLPFLFITLLVVAVILPITTALIEKRIEAEADRRLSQSAESVAALIERSSEEALLSANFCRQPARS